MRHVLLTPKQMAQADRLTVQHGFSSDYGLMQNAGRAVSDCIIKHFPDAQKVAVLCGPGNNGGDGYVAAENLRSLGCDVICFCAQPPKSSKSAAQAAKDWHGRTEALAAFIPADFDLIVDALFGAGLDRPLDKKFCTLVENIMASGTKVVAVDLPSGVSGATGAIKGAALRAALTITFFTAKPGHWLYPGRLLCGDVVVADIGIKDSVLSHIACDHFLNVPSFWHDALPKNDPFQHKYSRGHVAVFSGPKQSTGASRLAARGAARIGAGAVSLLSLPDAIVVNAVHLSAIMLHKMTDKQDALTYIKARKVRAAVLGPGFARFDKARKLAALLLEQSALHALILDADGLSAFQNRLDDLVDIGKNSATTLVLTPHEGEFARLFPRHGNEEGDSRIEKAILAAKQCNAILVLKGADTIIAAPDGRVAININGTPLLATAGSGDVLSGFIAGLIAQSMPSFEAACAAVWCHAEAAKQFGHGLIAEDLPETLPKVLTELYDGNGL